MRYITVIILAAALGGCATTGDRSANSNNWYAKQCSAAVDELGLCPYNRF